MNRCALGLLAVIIGATLGSAVDVKDTSAASFTRTKKLKGTVTLAAKNEPILDIIKEISSQLEDAKLGPLSVDFAVGISKNTKTTYSCDKLPADEALDGLLKTLELGYVIVSKDKDRYDGWLKIVKGTNRGYEIGTEPKDAPKTEPKPVVKPEPKSDPKPEPVGDKATEQEEKAAAVRLATAKELIKKGKEAQAKPLLKYLMKYSANTKAGAEAKELMDKMK